MTASVKVNETDLGKLMDRTPTRKLVALAVLLSPLWVPVVTMAIAAGVALGLGFLVLLLAAVGALAAAKLVDRFNVWRKRPTRAERWQTTNDARRSPACGQRNGKCGFVPPTPGYAACTRAAGHEGPCAHPFANVVTTSHD